MRTVLACALLIAFGARAEAPDPQLKALVEDTKAVALGMQQHIAARLKAELEAGGIEGALAVCTAVAESAASRASRERGWRIARVSLKPRNALVGFADPWEQRALLDFESRRARGEDPAQMEHFEIVNEPAGRYLRYLKALPVMPLCMNCHGPSDTLKPEIRAALQKEYPLDRATGFSVGQIRGGLAVKRPL
ncbi:MAG TPA: DUF3365 domain-containing protein [Burkholderiales bacterium]|nr:DUF3365 domain-containing protein [Burkholderiales bacterium]